MKVTRAKLDPRKQRLAKTPIQTWMKSLSSLEKRMWTPHLGTHWSVLLT